MRILIAGAAGMLGTDARRVFADVPKNHWAYPSVETLRTTHILRGYPSGTANAK